MASGLATVLSGTEGLRTLRWREMDSNLRYAATVHRASAAVVPLGGFRSQQSE